MMNGSKILALIPARGGSKGIKNKNITHLCGKPLISYTIEAAKNCHVIDDVIVTTDSDEIAETAKRYGAEVPFLRPEELAADTSKTIDTVVHALEKLKEEHRNYNVIVLLQPTSPLRTSEDIRRATEEFFAKGRRGLVSVSPVQEPPILMRNINEKGELQPLLPEPSTVRRQDMRPYYRVNGSIYINLVSDINESLSFNDNPIGFLMEEEHSVDIDDENDLMLAEYLLRKKG